MTEFIIAFLAFVGIIALMALGVIFHRASIKGSCGGLNQIGVDKVCDCKTSCENEEKSKTLYQIQEPDKRSRAH
ncbi:MULTISPECIES: (Na+)-NQR maturation NqrM [Vibrio]|uniref:(Na+)-NQR maturation NqrM n=1 Tax=Vibrio proteolyticus NBRC 13287 TaxID=1219065 RepID=U3A3U7_VIBPR|nr:MULTISPECIES: (Na+)-NQR maturation NqrM [Vibrio]NAW56898.1 (Na+)-NQR maturation NqrM [Vibrio sp. V36_P2S2PM302]NAX20713.1 (Na+)-NQR maturation NqrM [Vibrio sp. V39_P1S14PM300]NAX27598.1 (Na+)-NQR maturation NqrM [Vibrio sp. V38_P2S17PM301]NAX32710.1 (Na+)-NQR maturation NqrM [Vibrio sp. V37_P2S8PM304]GAD68355.1 hypothetical protein VPR01S_13_00190 [Vibrio proteolyticus NBRC 13287]